MAFTSWYGEYPIIYRVFYIPGGVGVFPSTVFTEIPAIMRYERFEQIISKDQRSKYDMIDS